MALKTGDYVGNQWDKGIIPLADDRLVGLEIEVEHAPGLNLYDPHLGLGKIPVIDAAMDWMQVTDLSLRNNGAEFVSIPLKISRVAEAVESLFNYQKLCMHSWVGSIRTGIHVHVNVRDFTGEHLRNLAVTYPLVEPALFEYVGAEREECIYCVPWYRAPGDAKLAASYLSDNMKRGLVSHLRNMSQHLSKYSALYLSPITRIGTVEFRHAPTWVNETKIVTWANICERIVSYARKTKDTASVIEHFELNPSQFVRDVTEELLVPSVGYQSRVTRLGADILAASLFPEVLPEWVRLGENWMPAGCVPSSKKIKPWVTKSLPTKVSDSHIPIGTTKVIGLSGKLGYWHGPGIGWKWTKPPQVEQQGLQAPIVHEGDIAAAPASPPHGYTIYDGESGMYKKWDSNVMAWVKHTIPPPLEANELSMAQQQYNHFVNKVVTINEMQAGMGQSLVGNAQSYHPLYNNKPPKPMPNVQNELPIVTESFDPVDYDDFDIIDP